MPRSKLAKSGLMALREMLTRKAPRKQELVPEDLFRGAAEGNEQAVARIAEQQGEALPENQDKLAELLARVKPNRREFLRGLGQAGASAFGPSPLTILRQTMEDIGILEMNPREMMEYSKKYLDRPFRGEIGDFGNPNEPQALVSDAIENMWTGDVDYVDVLKNLELESSKGNLASIESLDDLVAQFSPSQSSMILDDMRDSASSYATGEYYTGDDTIREIFGDSGRQKTSAERRMGLEKDIEGFLVRLNPEGGMAPRFDADEAVAEYAWESGMMEEVQENTVDLIIDEALKQHSTIDFADSPKAVIELYESLESVGLDDTQMLGDLSIMFDTFIDRKTGKLRDSVRNLSQEGLITKLIDDFEGFSENPYMANRLRKLKNLPEKSIPE